ncbi:hypothetical protein RJ640_015182 [Escallonia rubra]|uniref:Uncharacterized protein n=1 Tax=Escallonia rubra TaxID=112253 RepID=A0AA88RP34_9ASTE|nr:hypothetical protein RJ640_015182 [Escallonia rubra]
MAFRSQKCDRKYLGEKLLDGRNIRVQYAYGGRSPGPQVTTHQVLAVYRHYLDVLLTARMKGNFITAEDTSSEVTGLPSFTRMQAIPDSGWRPRGVLVAYLQEHGSAVNDIAISTDHSFFVSASEDCTVKVWDSRKLEKDISCRPLWKLRYVTSLVTGPCGNWFVTGSSRGVLTLWDIRFCIPVNPWQFSPASPVEEMCPFVAPRSTSLSATARPLVYVAAGCNEVSLWNAENGSCHQV